jgi:hypothetical protein
VGAHPNCFVDDALGVTTRRLGPDFSAAFPNGSSTIEAVRRASLRQRVAGVSVSPLGTLLLGVPVFDIWDEAANLS